MSPDKERLDKIFDELRKMEITPLGYILDFLIEQGITLEQVTAWFKDYAS